MDENGERFRRDVFEQSWIQIREERSKLKWEYDNGIDAFYKKSEKAGIGSKNQSKVVLTVLVGSKDDANICATVCCCGALV